MQPNQWLARPRATPVTVLRPLGLEDSDLHETHTLYRDHEGLLHSQPPPNSCSRTPHIGPVTVSTAEAFADACPGHVCLDTWTRKSPEAYALLRLRSAHLKLPTAAPAADPLVTAQRVLSCHQGRKLLDQNPVPSSLQHIETQLRARLSHAYAQELETLRTPDHLQGLATAWHANTAYPLIDIPLSEFVEQFQSTPTHLVVIPTAVGCAFPVKDLAFTTTLAYLAWGDLESKHILLTSRVVSELLLALDHANSDSMSVIPLIPGEDPTYLAETAGSLWDSSSGLPIMLAIDAARTIAHPHLHP